MPYLIIVTLIWAFSFRLIGEYLAGQVDSYFAVLIRVLVAGLAFLPLTHWRISHQLKGGIIAIGALQFGFTYVCLYQSFLYLSVAEVLLYTIFTPLYVTLIDDLLNKRFSPTALGCALIAVVGAGIIRYQAIDSTFVVGVILLQLANFTFALGQVAYKHLLRHYQPSLPSYQYFGYFYLGALCIVLPAFILFGNGQLLPKTVLQWSILLWLGLGASAFGFYGWNKGACLVDAGTLAVMNNAVIPVGLLMNIVIWQHPENMLRLSLGGFIMMLSLWLNYRFTRPKSI